MDRSLARGHVNRFLDGLADHEIFGHWPAGTRLPCIALLFRETARAASPEQPLRRLRPLLSPVFPVPKVIAWSPRTRSELVTRALTHAKASSVLHPDSPDQSLFDERAVFLSRIRMTRTAPAASQGRGTVACEGGATASIGAHAMQRLLERGLATPETLGGVVASSLVVSEALHDAFGAAEFNPDRPWSLLLPLQGGAAAVVTHRVRPWPGADEGRALRIASVRTVLREEMLTPDQQDRHSGCGDPLELRSRDPRDFTDWVRRNARPWVQATAVPDRTPEPRSEELSLF